MKHVLFGLCGVLLLHSACQRPSENTCASDFDQTALLTNMGENIILPAYQNLKTRTEALHQKALDFVQAPTIAGLEVLREEHLETWETWMSAGIFEFGPAADEELRAYFDRFPANITRINEGITSGTYDLTTPAYEYARGLSTLDYLLHGENQPDADIVAAFANDPNRGQYLTDVTDLYRIKARDVEEAWSPTGANYLTRFIDNTGVANGKSLSDLINQWNKAFELIKNDRIGNPISAKTGYTPLLPDRVEAYYSGYSLRLLSIAMTAHRNVFLGVQDNLLDGIGLDDFLNATGASKGDQLLSEVIINQYEAIDDAWSVVIDGTGTGSSAGGGVGPFSEIIVDKTEDVKAYYAAAQNQVVHLKTDLPAALCINITYIDNVDDGD